MCCASQVPTSRILKFVHLRHASDHLTTQSMKSRSSIIGAFLNPPAASRGKARSHFFQVATTRMSSACLDKRRAFSHVTRLCMATSRSMLLALARSECHVHGTPHAHRSAKTRETANIKRRSPRRPSELEFHEHLQSWQSCRWHSEHSSANFAVEVARTHWTIPFLINIFHRSVNSTLQARYATEFVCPGPARRQGCPSYCADQPPNGPASAGANNTSNPPNAFTIPTLASPVLHK